MKKININNIEYEIIKDENNSIKIEDLEEKLTEYFEDFDYILGDYSYEKLRLKGYYDNKNTKVKNINNIKYVEDYIKKYCSYETKVFILKKFK